MSLSSEGIEGEEGVEDGSERKRKVREWEELRSSTRESRISTALQQEACKAIWEEALKKTQKLLKSAGIPTKVEVELQITTPTQEKRRKIMSEKEEGSGLFDWKTIPVAHQTDQFTTEEDLQKMIKRASFVCTKYAIPSRARDALLSSTRSPIKGKMIAKEQKSILEVMKEKLPLHVVDGVDCAWICPKQLVELVMGQLVDFDKREVRIVFSGDGRSIRKKPSVALFLKFIIRREDSRKTKWVFPFLLGKGKEKAENLAFMMTLVREKLKDLNGHIVQLRNGRHCKVKMEVCADGKFLNMVLGLEGHTGSFSCPFCMLQKSQWSQAMFEKFLIDPSDYERKSIDELFVLKKETMHCSKHKNSRTCREQGSKDVGAHGRRVGYAQLLKGMNFQLEDLVVDELHMFLRLFDGLLDRLLFYIEAHDIEHQFEELVDKKIPGVVFHLESGVTKKGEQCWSPLNGDMAWKLMEGLIMIDPSTSECVMREIFLHGKNMLASSQKEKESHDYYCTLKFSFEALKEIMSFLREEKSLIRNIYQLRVLAIAYCQRLILFFGPRIANGWYFHILGCHLFDILKRHDGSILDYSCAAQERVNGIHGKLLINCVIQQNSSVEILQIVLRSLYFSFFDEEKSSSPLHQYPKIRSSVPFNPSVTPSLLKRDCMDSVVEKKTSLKKNRQQFFNELGKSHFL